MQNGEGSGYMDAVVTSVSAYHNYKYHGILRKDILYGEENGKVFIAAREVNYPDEFPRLSLTLYGDRGELITVIAGNVPSAPAKGYFLKKEKDGLEIFNSRKEKVFGYRVVRYQNVFVTEIDGRLFDDRGKEIIP